MNTVTALHKRTRTLRAARYGVIPITTMVLVALLLCTGVAPATAQPTPAITRVSIASTGTQANNVSLLPAISADARFIAFESAATNLVPDDTNGAEDIFLYDRTTRQTTRVSVATDGTQARASSHAPSISADGRYIAFSSDAGNLVANDINGHTDIFVHDRQARYTSRVSISSRGWAGNNVSTTATISQDGRYVAFRSEASNLVDSDTNRVSDVFVHDRQTKETTRVSVASDGAQGDLLSEAPAISGDGRYVAFLSRARNLVADDKNGRDDVFVHDRKTNQTTRVSRSSGGMESSGDSYSPAISANGRYVAFRSHGSNLVDGDTNANSDVFVYDRIAGKTIRVSVSSGGGQANDWSSAPSLSADGRYVAFQSWASNLVGGDTNGLSDIFVHDRTTGQTNRVSAATLGQANGRSSSASLSADGRYIAFASEATNFGWGDTNKKGDIFVSDRQADPSESDKISPEGMEASGWSYTPTVSQDGRYIAYRSDAANLVPGDTNKQWDIFVHDTTTQITERVSIASGGEQANGASFAPSISGDGRYVTFYSDASNLVAGDTNREKDVFVHDRETNTTTRISIASSGAEGNSQSTFPTISADGRYVTFRSSASNLVEGDTNGYADIFVHDRNTQQTTRISVSSDGQQADLLSKAPAISADGHLITFVSRATNLVRGDTNSRDDVFVHDRTTKETTRVSIASNGTEANDDSLPPDISADGRYVTFRSRAGNLVPSDANGKDDVFVYDRQQKRIERVSVGLGGAEANDWSAYPAISADGRYVAFRSFATNLVPDDTNRQADIFVYDRKTQQTSRVSIASDGTQANRRSFLLDISGNGQYVAFGSRASNLVGGDTNNAGDVFVHARETKKTVRVSVASDRTEGR